MFKETKKEEQTNEGKIRRDAHWDIDHIFKELLPAQGLPERPEQTALSHRMLDVMLNGQFFTSRKASPILFNSY